jgi:hypothetical protein
VALLWELHAFRSTAQFADFRFHALDAMVGIGMVGEEVRWGFGFFGGGIQIFEEGGHGARIVAGVVENLGAHYVGLRFRAARIVEKHAAEGELSGAGGGGTCSPTEDAPGRANDASAKLGILRLGGLIGAMTERYVGEFLGHHSRELRFIVGGFDGATIDEDKTAGKSAGIDGLVVDAVKFPRIVDAAGVEMLDQALPEFAEIGVDLRIIAHGHFLFDFIGGPAAQRDVLLRGKGVGALRRGGRCKREKDEKRRREDSRLETAPAVHSLKRSGL